jgi:hypothetical protein
MTTENNRNIPEIEQNEGYIPSDADFVEELDQFLSPKQPTVSPKKFASSIPEPPITIDPSEDLEYVFESRYPQILAYFLRDLESEFQKKIKELFGQKESYRRMLEFVKNPDEKIVEAGSLGKGKYFTIVAGYPREQNEQLYQFSMISTGKSGKKRKKLVKTTTGQTFPTTQLVLIKA